MAHFVKWRGASLDEGSPSISHTIQSTEVGKAFRFGIWGGDGLTIGPNDRSVAQLNPRMSVEGRTNNITWYELVGLREANVMVEARNPGDGAVWDYFQLAVKKATAKARAPVRGVNFDYHVDTKGIGPDTNASMVLTLKLAMIPHPPTPAVLPATSPTNWAALPWTPKEWSIWAYRFKSIIERSWSEKFWLTTPASLSELEVAAGGSKRRVQLHCVLRVDIANAASAHHKIKVVKTNAPPGSFPSNSTMYAKQDVNVELPATHGWPKPFTAVVHEIGHTLGLHHSCEQTTPSAPYCALTDPASNEVMAQGNELRPAYATPWQIAAASWFNSSGHGHSLKPNDFPASLYRVAPAPV
jgi:hypothetical protein